MLCDKTILNDACVRLNQYTMSFWGTSSEQNTSRVHAAQLAQHFMTTLESIVKLLKSFGVKNVETDPTALSSGAYAVTCADLCAQTLNSFKVDERPPSSDLGCYWISGISKPVCDINLTPEKLLQIDLPDRGRTTAGKTMHEPGRTRKVKNARGIAALKAMNYEARGRQVLRYDFAELFRFYPAVPTLTAARNDGQVATQTWQQGIFKSAIRARAFLTTALNGMSASSVPDVVLKYYGSNSDATRKTIRKTISFVRDMLMSVNFMFKGKYCDATTLAYVIAKPPARAMTKGGQYIVSLCELFFKVPLSQQVMTFIHEGSHHLPTETKDVAYGKMESQALAAKSTSQALANADNFCYFINDAARHAAMRRIQLENPVSALGSTTTSRLTPGPIPTTVPPLATTPAKTSLIKNVTAVEKIVDDLKSRAITATAKIAGDAAKAQAISQEVTKVENEVKGVVNCKGSGVTATTLTTSTLDDFTLARRRYQFPDVTTTLDAFTLARRRYQFPNGTTSKMPLALAARKWERPTTCTTTAECPTTGEPCEEQPEEPCEEVPLPRSELIYDDNPCLAQPNGTRETNVQRMFEHERRLRTEERRLFHQADVLAAEAKKLKERRRSRMTKRSDLLRDVAKQEMQKATELQTLAAEIQRGDAPEVREASSVFAHSGDVGNQMGVDNLTIAGHATRSNAQGAWQRLRSPIEGLPLDVVALG
eukprot:TRINITY_DN3209_c0_g1_i1.p1 TRINITY_DN3209_c0_g1~~TRINITY_DN3209_c0_g1_i1.p1  ORF type:complete len:789 (+),score=110.81 TRINITY_DN3209_c0_g1_i1:241-2367(+)